MEPREGKGTIVMSPVGKDDRGFTLLELLVVLLLLGLASSIVLPAIDRRLREQEVRQSALEVAAVARDLKNRARDEGSLQRLVFNPLENSYQTFPGKKIILPSDIRLTAVEGGEPIGGGLQQFLFFPNGSVHGKEVGISGREGSSLYLIRLDPLTGRVWLTKESS